MTTFGCACFFCRRRLRQRIKAAILVVVALAVSTAPLWGLKAFLYVCGGITFVVGLVALGMALEFWRGFRAFEAWTGEQAQRIFGRR